MAQDNLVLDGPKLGRFAARRGLLRGDVARLAGVSSATQANAFSGRPVSVSTALKIAKAVRVPLRKLLADDDAMTREPASAMSD